MHLLRRRQLPKSYWKDRVLGLCDRKRYREQRPDELFNVCRGLLRECRWALRVHSMFRRHLPERDRKDLVLVMRGRESYRK